MDNIIAYAGIGSRKISLEEKEYIINLSKKLMNLRYVVYSGNAEGSDIAFQTGSSGKCVLLLPWKNFNIGNFNGPCLDKIDCGKTKDGIESIERFHPRPKSLSFGGRCMMSRNWHQIVGYGNYPEVKFVVCCANRDEHGNIIGGTGQACRIAKSKNIPVFNIRDDFFEETFNEFIESLQNEKI
jgi:hypothetical protein